MFAIPSARYDTSICQIPCCGKPLGAESKDMGFWTCHDHRLCSVCNLEMHAEEIRRCFNERREESDGNLESIELKHARCAIHDRVHDLSTDPTLSIKQSHYDFLNQLRLMVVPNPDLSVTTNENNAIIANRRFIENMDWDTQYQHLKMMEACVAHLSLAVGQNRNQIKLKADEREKIKAKEAKLQASTSSRPISKPADDTFEVQLAQFQANFGFTSRKTALKQQKLRDKAAEQLAKFMPSALAMEAANKMLRENIEKGTIKVTEDS